MSRHWHMGTWIHGNRGRHAATSDHENMHGLHVPLIEANGAYAHRLEHVKGDPERWVCFWACEIRHR